MTGVRIWGYGEGVESAAFWGWLDMLKKPVHAWAKALRSCKASRVTDNRVVYSGVKGGMVYPVNAIHDRRGRFSVPERTAKCFERKDSSRAGGKTRAARSVHDGARRGATIEALHKAQSVETGTDTAKVLKQKNGGI